MSVRAERILCAILGGAAFAFALAILATVSEISFASHVPAQASTPIEGLAKLEELAARRDLYAR